MAAILEISLVEKQVLDVFARCHGFFGHTPKRETERTIDMIWRGVNSHGMDYPLQDIVAAIENLLSSGMLYLDEKTGHIHLTDDGFAFICENHDLEA